MIDEQDDVPDAPDAPMEGEDVEIERAEDDAVEDTPDGGAIITLQNEVQAQTARSHFENIVQDVDPSELRAVVTDLLTKVEQDLEAREKRDKLYAEGLRRTGLGDDAPGGANFTGANKVVHPMLIEACVDFSARVMKELMPPNGPVKTKVYGPRDVDKMEKAARKAEFMNWQLTESVEEYRGELEQLTTQLGLGGVQYLKWRWDSRLKRPTCEFVPVDDMILPFAATNFYTAERRTHRQYITAETLRKRIEDGMYADLNLSMPQNPEFSKAEIANQKIEGKTDDNFNEDGLRTIYEISVTLDIERSGEYAPYIITIDQSSSRAMALVRNWDPEDPEKRELDHVAEHPFIPWRGSAPIGLTHLIGGLSATATGALRALLDSAHINNVPTGLKLKGGPQGQTLNPQVGQIIDVESSGMIDDIRKMFMALPFNPPNQTLFQLLGFVVDAGRGVVQTSFEKLSDVNQNTPVGTVMALIEQGLVTYSSIFARQHAAVARSLKILHRLNSSHLTAEILEAYNCGVEIRPEDFDGPSDVVPVSDPNIFSEAQRFAQTQAVQQRAAMFPQLYNQRKAEEMFLRSMKLDPKELLNEQPGSEDRDPVSENVAATLGQALYVLPGQDHVEHIKIHFSFLQSPLFGSNPAIAKTFVWPVSTHLRDHVVQFYRSECLAALRKAKQLGIALDGSSAEAAVCLSVQQNIEKQYPEFAQILAQVDQLAQQFKPQPQMPPDTSLQVAQIGAQLKTQELQQRAQLEAQKTQVAAQSDQADQQLAAAKLELERVKEQNRLMAEQIRQQQENKRAAENNIVRERMNTSDNETALRIAAAEIATGERVGVSSGTGINP